MASQFNPDTPKELEHTKLLIHELARLILPMQDEIENVWQIANRVYDRYAGEIAAASYLSVPLHANQSGTPRFSDWT